MQARLTVETERFLAVPMRDGVLLSADLYRPRRKGKYPGILVRTPYGKGRRVHDELAAHGYLVLVVDARGTGASDGVYTYYNMEDGLHDGYDLVEWLAAHPWCNGRVGTQGGSALGIYQVLTGWSKPPHLRCMSCAAYPLDFYTDQWYPGGVFRLENRLQWIAGLRNRTAPSAVFDQPPHQQNVAPDDPLSDDVTRRRRETRRLRYRHLEQHCRAGGDVDAWARPYLNTPVRTALWEAIDLAPLMRQTEVPILHRSTYYDHFGIGSIRGYRVHPGPKRLVVVPGNHGFRGEEQDLPDLDRAWFDYWLKGIGHEEAVLSPAVLAYATGAERWISLDAWPEPEPMVYGLTSEGVLRAGEGAGRVELACDPVDPVPSSREDDHRAFEKHEQVLTFTTSPFETDTTVLGFPELSLRVATGMPDANLLVRVCAVALDGASRQLNFGAQKLSMREDLGRPVPVPPQAWVDVTVRCWTISHVFAPGTRLRITLSLTDYPFFENAPHAGTLHADLAASRLTIPVVSSPRDGGLGSV